MITLMVIEMANPEYFTPKPRPSPANAAAPSLKGLPPGSTTAALLQQQKAQAASSGSASPSGSPVAFKQVCIKS